MRKTRWLLLLAILAIAGGVGFTYRLQRKTLEKQAPPRPAALSPDLNSSAEEWHWTQTRPGDGRPAVDITARKFGRVKDSSKTDLEGVEIHLFHKEGDKYDRVRAKTAQFFSSDRRLYSDDEVEITLGVPVDPSAPRKIITIRAPGVTFDSNSGKASTEREAHFTFQNGDGKSVGAWYDPTLHELHLTSAAELNWKSPRPGSKPMKLESAELIYKEAESTVWLMPWAKLTRDNTVIDSGPAVVTLDQDVIKQIEAEKAHGTDQYPSRRLQYSADKLWVYYGETGEVEKITGDSNARLVSTSEGAETTLTADRVDLEFTPSDGDSVLKRVLANNNAVADSKPIPVSGRELPEEHVLRSQVIEINMRPGGREIENVATHAPARLEFLPSRPVQHHRVVDAERMAMTYGPDNRIQSFRAIVARTETEPTPEEKQRKRGITRTASHDMTAEFDPKTGQLTRMEQWENFSYEEGDRKARAVRAILDSTQNIVTLQANSRMWDSTGTTSADTIRMDQRTGNFTATGHVNSSRMPDKKKPGSGMLSTEEPLEAMAEHMTSADRNQHVRYEGNVTVWQSANRIQADRVDIDREKRVLAASGRVISQFLDEAKTPADSGSDKANGSPAKKPATPVFTVVRAPDLVYTEEDRLAHYTGGVALLRPGLQVKAQELRAWLAESGAESRMEKAHADGQVQIVQSAAGKTKTGTGEHGEYYTAEEKVILRGGDPQLVDSNRGNTRGAELTYYANDDRLLVNGVPERLATSRIRKK